MEVPLQTIADVLFGWARDRRARKWAPALATVEHVQTYERSLGRGGRVPSVEIAYAYEVGSEVYGNTDERFIDDDVDLAFIAHRLRKGGRVAIRYNPRDPKESCLDAQFATA